MALSSPRIILLAAIAGIINLLPRLLSVPGADVFMHYSMIDCFSHQLWHGDLYPRWCMESNAGLGSPAFFFYPPLPYYIAALFYPLHIFGLTVPQQYLCALWLAGGVTFLTCWCWLADIVTPGRAMLGAFLFLWMPYRMELVLFRSAYAELWCMAFLPLLFLFTRRLMTGAAANWVPLAFCIALCLMSHVMATVNALLGAGIYVFIMAVWCWRRLIWFALAVAVAGLMAAIYLVPAQYFMSSLHPEGLKEFHNFWVNRFIGMGDIGKRWRVIMALAIMWLYAMAFGVLVLWQRRRITDNIVHREIFAWAAITAFAMLMFFGISKPVWKLLDIFAVVSAPWRMQFLIAFAAIFFFSVAIEWLVAQKQMKTWKMDYAGMCLLFIFSGLFIITAPDSESSAIVNRVVQSHIIFAREYTTRWTHYPDFRPIIMKQADEEKRLPSLKVVSGQGTVKVIRWDVGGIRLFADMAQDSVLRVAHFYFPVWQAQMDGKLVPVSPEFGTGFMLLDVPAGKHEIVMYRDIGEGAPAAVRWSPWISALAFCACLMIYCFQHRCRYE